MQATIPPYNLFGNSRLQAQNHGRLTIEYYPRRGPHRNVSYEVRTPTGSGGAKRGESLEEAIASAQARLRRSSNRYQAVAVYGADDEWWTTDVYVRELAKAADGTWHAAKGADLVSLTVGDPDRRKVPLKLTFAPSSEEKENPIAAIVTAAGTINVGRAQQPKKLPAVDLSWHWAESLHGELTVDYVGKQKHSTVTYRLSTPMARDVQPLNSQSLPEALQEARKIVAAKPYRTAQAVFENDGTFYSTDAYVKRVGAEDEFWGRSSNGPLQAARIGTAADPTVASMKLNIEDEAHHPLGIATEQGVFQF
jgi:hypothetical protein